jgi:hypothetical protein
MTGPPDILSLDAFSSGTSSKTSGTTLPLSIAGGRTLAFEDYVAVAFACDPAAGAVSFSAAGTAFLSAWTIEQDVANGSGTSGVRAVLAYALCTGAGTLTGITVTHPTLTARAARSYRVSGADNTTPINGSSSGGGAVTPAVTGVAVTCLVFIGDEAADASTVTGGSDYVSSAGSDTWTAVSGDTVTSGTTGGGGASNISTAVGYSTTPAVSADYSPAASVAGTSEILTIGWQEAALLDPPLAELAMPSTTGA